MNISYITISSDLKREFDRQCKAANCDAEKYMRALLLGPFNEWMQPVVSVTVVNQHVG